MTWPDLEKLVAAQNPNGAELSPDGKRWLWSQMAMNWADGSRNGDIYMVSTDRGVSSIRQLTSTPAKMEAQPKWTPDGQSFVFVSNREGTGAASVQLYLMRADSGAEPRKITEVPTGVSTSASTFDFSPDGRLLVYRAGRAPSVQLYALPVGLLNGDGPIPAPQITKHPTGVAAWQFSPDSKRIYFTSTEAPDPDERARVAAGFTVILRHQPIPRTSLFALDLATQTVTQVDSDTAWSVVDFTQSRDGRWLAYRVQPTDPAKRVGPEQQFYSELFLVDVASGRTERLTNNPYGLETLPTFSPDGKLIAFAGSDDPTIQDFKSFRVWVRGVDETGKPFRKLGAGFENDMRASIWSPDSKSIYFDATVKATRQIHAVDVATGRVRQVTNLRGAVTLSQEASGHLIAVYSDPVTPETRFFIPSFDRIADRNSWVQLNDMSGLIRDIALGAHEEVEWKSADGTTVGGTIMKPVGYEAGKRYPLIVVLHGGPHSSEVLQFNGDGSDGGQIYAGAGYLVFFPNYRGSTGYGEKFKLDIVGNYSQKQFEDVMSGVDHLIARGLADGNRMGVIGNSSGGTLGNWILTHTNRFKAISSGAGISNWVSMYAQSDVQRQREFWMKGTPYTNHAEYWRQSPIAYIANAKTPTLIWAIEDEARVPAAQSIELYMGLRKHGVPTELLIYPGDSHATPNSPRNRLHRITAEMMWMDYWVRGSGKKFSWREMLKMIE